MIPDIIVLRPEWLLIAGVCIAAALWLRLRPVGGNWDRLMDSHLLVFLSNDGGADRNLLNRYLLLGAGICVALSGPAVPDQQAAGYRQLESWVIVLDL